MTSNPVEGKGVGASVGADDKRLAMFGRNTLIARDLQVGLRGVAHAGMTLTWHKVGGQRLDISPSQCDSV